MKKGTKLYSMLKFKCPHCHEGDFFVSHPYNLSKAGDIHQKCPVCGEKNEKEPGFYYGSMFVSYGLGAAVFISTFAAMNLFFSNFDWINYLFIVIGLLVILSPLLYALSKIIWANFFYSYKGKKNINEQYKTN
ncbi:MAG: DUF983 domain-containing protein [Bacteroidia bacterium]